MDDFTRFSRFALIFTGDGKVALTVSNWDALIGEIKSHLWHGEPNQPEWDETVAHIEDAGNWRHDDYGPWSYYCDFEDGSMIVYRLND